MCAKFNFLADRAKSIVKFACGRRPARRTGIGKIVAELQLEHPEWTDSRLQAQANSLWHQRNRSAK